MTFDSIGPKRATNKQIAKVSHWILVWYPQSHLSEAARKLCTKLLPIQLRSLLQETNAVLAKPTRIIICHQARSHDSMACWIQEMHRNAKLNAVSSADLRPSCWASTSTNHHKSPSSTPAQPLLRRYFCTLGIGKPAPWARYASSAMGIDDVARLSQHVTAE
jgi:hypothetical protein